MVDIAAIDLADSRAIDELFEAGVAANAHDRPGVPYYDRAAIEAMLRVPSPGQEQETLLARVGGRVVGLAFLEMSTLENRHLVTVFSFVRPEHRHRGVGRALLDAAVAAARARGRDTMHVMVTEPLPGGGPGSPDGRRFCEAAGMERVLEDVRYRLDLSTVDPAVLGAARSAAWEHAGGYEILQWCDGTAGEPPEEVLDGLAALLSRFWSDTPTGDAEVEDMAYDAQRLRDGNRSQAAHGRELVNTVARVKGGGEVAAWTKLILTREDRHFARQGITMVAAAHRGRRLGTVVKTENLRLVREVEPRLRLIDTENAATNTPMIAVNEALGFVPYFVTACYQLKF